MKPAFEISGIKEYIAYDPGGHTGFAKCKVHLNESLLEIIEVGEFPIWHNIESQLARRDKDSFVVVYESFHLRMIVANINTLPSDGFSGGVGRTDVPSVTRYRPSSIYVADTFVHSGMRSIKDAESVNTPVGSSDTFNPDLFNSLHNPKANSLEQHSIPI